MLSIIDRKKNMFKTSLGFASPRGLAVAVAAAAADAARHSEYIAAEKIETVLKRSRFVQVGASSTTRRSRS